MRGRLECFGVGRDYAVFWQIVHVGGWYNYLDIYMWHHIVIDIRKLVCRVEILMVPGWECPECIAFTRAEMEQGSQAHDSVDRVELGYPASGRRA